MTQDGEQDSVPTTSDLTRLRRIGDELLHAWEETRGGGSADLESFLPPVGDALRVFAMRHLVLLDMGERLRRGEAVLLESYLDRFAELGQASSLSAELIHSELQLRRRYDKHVTLASYRERFPQQYAELEKLDAAETTGKTSDSPLQNSSTGTMRAPTFPSTDPPVPQQDDRKSNSSFIQTDGGYELKKQIGRGQFGEVWSAEAPGGVEVAVKIISFPADHKMTQMELQALEVMKRLRHTFLIQVQAYWIDEDQLFIVMELGDETLADMAQRFVERDELIPVDVLLRHIREASEAIDFLHSESVLHRDIKPENILLVSGHIKVSDFGIARVLGERNLTITATTMGTPLYMAPEVWGGRASPQSDQYSLAMTYAELRMGRPPYSSNSLAAVMNDHLESQPNLDALEEREQPVVAKALSKDPNQRYATCAEFAAALQIALASKEPVQSERSGNPLLAGLWTTVAGIAICALLGLGILMTWPNRTTTTNSVAEPPLAPLVTIAGCRAVEDAGYELQGGQRFWREIVWESAGGQQTELILIPHKHADDPPTFYLMKHKVSNQLFDEFVRVAGVDSLHPSTQWELGGQAGEKDLPAQDHPSLPVYRVHIEDAERFAQWMNEDGRLPSAAQWDKAAGRDLSKFEGPYDRPLAEILSSSDANELVACNRLQQGPLPVGAATADISLFGCRDMAGNGMEWTRTTNDNITYRSVVEIPDGEPVQLRGAPYRYGEPFTFGLLISEDHDFVSPEISFRVVFEVPSSSKSRNPQPQEL